MQNNYSALTSINVNGSKDAENDSFISISGLKTLNNKKLQNSFLVISDSTAFGSDVSYISTLPNINIANLSNKQCAKDLVFMLAKGRYSDNQKGKIIYKDADINQKTFNYSDLKDFYDDYCQL